MLRNYLKIAFRTLRRQKGYAFINVFGLALGIACCVLLFLFVRNEWTHDRFHEKADRIFRVIRGTTSPEGDMDWGAAQPAKLAPTLEAMFPEVQETVRLIGGGGEVRVATGTGDYIKEEEVLYVDSTFFEVFTFPLLHGNPQTALAEPNAVVLSERAARKYFGEEQAMGQVLTVKIDETTLDLRVTGVAENPPVNSSIQFDLLLPFEIKKDAMRGALWDQWAIGFFGTFVVLHGPEQAEALAAKLPAFVAQHYPSGTTSGDDEDGVTVFGVGETQLRLQPLADIHLSPEVSAAALTPPSDPLYSFLLSDVALLVLLVACINFTTLALGRSAARATEVGVRKVVGAHRGQIRRQFWGEALLTSGAALFFGLILARLFLPVFNQLAEKELNLILAPGTVLFLVALMGVIGLLAGSYPALVLSRFEPARILRGQGVLGGGWRLTRGLVVVQFTLSIALVVGTLVMSAQLGLMQTDLGFNEEQVVVIEGQGGTSEVQEIYEPFRQEVLRNAAIKQVAGGSLGFFGGGVEGPLALGDTAQMRARVLPVSATFLETLEIETVAGRDFSLERPPDKHDVLVNEAFVRAMGWASPVGKRFSFAEDSFLGHMLGELRVIGVTEDFHVRSLHQEIAPLVFVPSAAFYGVSTIYAHLAPGEISEGMAALRTTWQQVAPGRPFEYQFLDEVVEEAYEAEQRWRAIIRYAAGFALVIACFGLFGLAALAAERRTKEIGIRKVLGASATNITLLLSKDFLKLIGVAFVLAVPLAYFGLQRWLEEFAYRVELGPKFFLVAGALVALLSIAAVSYQAIRAALADPVDALRYE